MRDDFLSKTKELLARRVGHRCSNPKCRKATSGPDSTGTKAVNIGVAAHIAGASNGGPRFDPVMTSEERASASNGIWLCQTCSKLVDSDESKYTKVVLVKWKLDAEQEALREIESPARSSSARHKTLQIVTHVGTVEEIVATRCRRHGKPTIPGWLTSSPSRMSSDWLVERLTNKADLQIFFDPNWCDGIWFVADLSCGDGVVINKDQLDDLMPPSPTTTTTTPPKPPES